MSNLVMLKHKVNLKILNPEKSSLHITRWHKL